MMILQVIRGYRKTMSTVLLCALILTGVMLMLSFLLPFASQVEKADVLNEESYTGVLVPATKGVLPNISGYISFQNDGFERVSGLAAVAEARSLAYAYSPSLVPCHVPEHGECEHGTCSAVMPTSFFCGSVTCEGEELQITENSSTGTRYDHTYDCRLDEAVFLYSAYGEIETLTVNMTIYNFEESMMEVGKTYLVWGTLIVDEAGAATLFPLRPGNDTHGMLITEEKGKHWRLESKIEYNEISPILPWFSELQMPLDEFWKTEAGKLWQEDILSIGEIQHHSVRVIGTDCLDSVLPFHRGSAYVVEGVTLEESGERYSCLISEELAELNGLKVGDLLPLELYRGMYAKYDYSKRSAKASNGALISMYDPYDGILEKHTYRVVGIYRTEDDMHDSHAVHPGTIFVPQDSMLCTYGPLYWIDSIYYNDGSYITDLKYSLLFPIGAKELIVTELTSRGYSSEYFLYDDGGYAEDKERLGALDEAMTAVQSGSRIWVAFCGFLLFSVTVAILFVLVWSAKGEIGRNYAVNTSDRRVFWYLYLRQVGILLPTGGAAALPAAALRRPFAVWWMSRFTDSGVAEELMAYLPTFSVGMVAAVPVFCLLAAIPVALCGVRRKYHYEYHEDGKGEMTEC